MAAIECGKWKQKYEYHKIFAGSVRVHVFSYNIKHNFVLFFNLLILIHFEIKAQTSILILINVSRVYNELLEMHRKFSEVV